MTSTAEDSLVYVVEEFESCGADPETARGECINESTRFQMALAEVGIEADLVYGGQFVDFMGHAALATAHTAVRVGDVVYDWTARQFPPHDQDFPLVQPYDEWRAQWHSITKEDD